MFISVRLWQTNRMLMLLARLSFRGKPKKRADTDKGALYHEYDIRVHQFIAHIQLVHLLKKDLEMDVEIKGKIVVKAANPLAAPIESLSYTHSKTKMHNEIFFMS